MQNAESLKMLPLSFYQRDAATVARALLGKILVRRLPKLEIHARIVETEAYVGPHDLACHASKGRTARTEIMFGPGGHAYVYLIYGMYDMFNIVTGSAGDAQAVLLRAAEALPPHAKLLPSRALSGPGKLAKTLQITRRDNGASLESPELFILNDPSYRPRIEVSPRIGVDYAGQWKDAPLRFVDARSPEVSKPPRSKLPPIPQSQ